MMKKKKCWNLCMIGLFFCILLIGCHNTEKLSPEQLDAYQQMTLYIQEGFRKYVIEGAYQAYFSSIEEGDEKCYCEILLVGEEKLWEEYISYTYDAETGWYSFEGQYEPIFAKDSFWAIKEDSSFAVDMRDNYVYEVQIAKEIDIAIPIHYFSESGPIERDERKYLPYRKNDLTYSVIPMLYTYQDDRMDIDITIEYPQILFIEDERGEIINERLKEAFFYSYGAFDEENTWMPNSNMYTMISRNYFITKQDERYLSLRIYENNCSRRANHPNEWETGITIDMQTGEVLSLKDVIGEEWTLESLSDSGAFKCLEIWENDSDQNCIKWIEENMKNGNSTLSDYDSYFYLTDDGIGLISHKSRYYVCIEASFKKLGIEKR